MRKPICDVIVIDTMAAVTAGSNENSGEDMGKLLAHCKWIHKETGALVLLIAHSGKDSSRGIRGWSGTKAALDAEIEITRNGDYRTATVTKLKDSEDGASYPFKLKTVDLGLDADGVMVTSCVVEHVEAQAEVQGTGRQKPTSAHQITMMDVLRTVAPSGTVDYDDLLAGYAAKFPTGTAESKRDVKKAAKRALESLIAKRLAHMHGEDRVSLTSLVTSGDAQWLD